MSKQIKRLIKIPQMIFAIDTSKDMYADMLGITTYDVANYVFGKIKDKKLGIEGFVKNCEAGVIPPEIFFYFALMGYQDTMEFLSKALKEKNNV